MRVTASAPGKLFLAGEYAVVRGGSAIVAAVNRRVRCRLQAHPGSGALVARHLGIEHRTTLARDDGVGVPHEVRFLVTAAQHAARQLGLRDTDVAIETQTDLDDERGKRGLGGSAAITAAVIVGMHRIAGHPLDRETLGERVRTGVAAHRTAQGGGSGADVVAATVGGIVWIRGLGCDLASAARGEGEGPAFESLKLPAGLALEVVATRRPALTGARVARYLEVCQGSGAAVATLAEWQKGMETSVQELRRSCRVGDGKVALAAVGFAGRHLASLAPLTGIRILTPELRSAIRAVGARGAAKASGAGGGDCAIALIAASAREDLREAWEAEGLEALAVEIDPRGAFAETEDDEGSRWQ